MGIQEKILKAAKEKQRENIAKEYWTCKKCGLLRSNKVTHKHGVDINT